MFNVDVMSLNTDLFASAGLVNNNSNENWANFDTFQSATNENTEVIKKTRR